MTVRCAGWEGSFSAFPSLRKSCRLCELVLPTASRFRWRLFSTVIFRMCSNAQNMTTSQTSLRRNSSFAAFIILMLRNMYACPLQLWWCNYPLSIGWWLGILFKYSKWTLLFRCCVILSFHSLLYSGDLRVLRWRGIFDLWNRFKFMTWEVIGN